MRANLIACCAACVFLTSPSGANPVTASHDDSALTNIEALGDREPDRWQGRHHYLYDDHNQPASTTTGSAPQDGQSCANEPVRLKRSDGSTVVRRIRRCD